MVKDAIQLVDEKYVLFIKPTESFGPVLVSVKAFFRETLQDETSFFAQAIIEENVVVIQDEEKEVA